MIKNAVRDPLFEAAYPQMRCDRCGKGGRIVGPYAELPPFWENRRVKIWVGIGGPEFIVVTLCPPCQSVI